jgi:hypothetical protein
VSLSGSPFTNCSKTFPCPVCLDTDHCSVIKAKRIVNCRNVDANEGEPRYDKGGRAYWTHHLDAQAGALLQQLPDAPPIAPVEKLDEVYKMYLNFIQLLSKPYGLSEQHLASLMRRGFSLEEIVERDYRTNPDEALRHAIADLLVKQFGEELCRLVPGFIPPTGDEAAWSLMGTAGILVPVRDEKGRIVSLKLRRDVPDKHGNRYLTISSSAHGGPIAHRLIHCPKDLYLDLTRVRVTEGELKADFIQQATEMNTLSLPGVGAYKQVVPALKALERVTNEGGLGTAIGTVVVALDADSRRKKTVALCLQQLVTCLKEAGYEVELETWNEGIGKGLDDLLLAGGEPTVLTGEEVDAEIAACLRACGIKTIREELTEIVTDVEAQQNLLPISENLARLDLILDVDLDQPREMIWFECEMERVASFKWKSTLKRLLRVQEMERKTKATEGEREETDGRTVIETYDRLGRDVAKDALVALVAANEPPELFNQGGSLKQLVETQDKLLPVDLRACDMQVYLDRCANWVETRSKRPVLISAPPRVALDLLSGRRDYSTFPELRGIVASPVFDRDGNLILTPGYHKRSGLYYAPKGQLDLAIDLTRPVTWEEAGRAATWVEKYMFGTLSLVGAADKSHAWSLFLLPFVRDMIDGPTPLHIINAPKEGTGKGLTNFVCTNPFVPGGPSASKVPANPEEWGKVLLGALKVAPSHIFFDNANYRVDSGALAQCLTERSYSDRRLGTNQIDEYPVRSVWSMTGNNVEVSAEIARRAVWMDLDANCEDPSTRKYEVDLKVFLEQNRSQQVWAALTIIRYWHQHGCPGVSGVTMGSYERYVQVIGGILYLIGVDGFLTNRRAVLDDYNSENLGWRAFVGEWWARHNTQEMRARDLAELGDNLPFWEEMGDGRNAAMSFGRRLKKKRNLVFCGKKITSRVVANQEVFRLLVVDEAEHLKDVEDRKKMVQG